MIASNLFTFGKEHPNQQFKETTNILQELQQTESVYLPDEITKQQYQPSDNPQEAEPLKIQKLMNQPQAQGRSVDIQTNIQLTNLQHDTLIFPSNNIIDPIPDSILPEISALSTTPLQLSCVQNVVIKKQNSINETEICERNESYDLVFCKFDQTEIVQNQQQNKHSIKQNQFQPNQLSQKQIVSKIQPPADVQEQIGQRTQPETSMHTQPQVYLITWPYRPMNTQPEASLPTENQTSIYAQSKASIRTQPQILLYNQPQVSIHNQLYVSLYNQPQASLHNQPQASLHNQPQTQIHDHSNASMPIWHQASMPTQHQASLPPQTQVSLHNQPLAPIPPQNNQPQIHTQQIHFVQERSNLQPQPQLRQIQQTNRLIVSKVIEFLLPVSIQNHSHSLEAESNVSSNIDNTMHIEPIPQAQNLKQAEFKVESAASSYLQKGHKTEEDHKLFESVLTPYIQLKFLIEPSNEAGAYLCQNGLILIAITRLITRDSKSAWLTQYIYEYFSTTFNVTKYVKFFNQEMEKANQNFATSLENMLIRQDKSQEDVQQDSKNEEKQKPIKRRYQTTQFVSLQTNKISHQQQTSHKKMVLNSNSMSINQKLGPYGLPQTKIMERNQTMLEVQRLPLQVNIFQEQPTQIMHQQSKDNFDQRLTSPIHQHKTSSVTSSHQKEGKNEDILIKLSQKLTKEEETKNSLPKKRQPANPIYITEQRKESKQIPDIPTPEASKFNQLYEKYKKIRESRESKSNDGTKIPSPQVYRVDQKQGDPIDHVTKKVQFAPDLRDEESYRDEEESRKKKRKGKSKGSKKDSSNEESDYEEPNPKEKLRKRGNTKK